MYLYVLDCCADDAFVFFYDLFFEVCIEYHGMHSTVRSCNIRSLFGHYVFVWLIKWH